MPLPSSGLIGPGVGDAFLRAVLPVNADAPEVYQELWGPTIVHFGDDNDNGLLDGGDPDILLTQLEEYRNLVQFHAKRKRGQQGSRSKKNRLVAASAKAACVKLTNNLREGRACTGSRH